MEKGLNSILVPFFFSAFCAAFCKLLKSFVFPLKWRTQCLNAFKNHHSVLGMPQSMNPLKTLFFGELIACVVKASWKHAKHSLCCKSPQCYWNTITGRAFSRRVDTVTDRGFRQSTCRAAVLASPATATLPLSALWSMQWASPCCKWHEANTTPYRGVFWHPPAWVGGLDGLGKGLWGFCQHLTKESFTHILAWYGTFSLLRSAWRKKNVYI